MTETPSPAAAAALSQPTPQQMLLSGRWTALGLGRIESRLNALRPGDGGAVAADASGIEALDSAGAWVLSALLTRLRAAGATVDLQGLSAADAGLLASAGQARTDAARLAGSAGAAPAALPPPTALQGLGRTAVAAAEQAGALLAFIGECAVAIGGSLRHPARWRGRTILFNLRTAGFDALPIVGLLSFLLGVVVAYQGAAQLRLYGANIFVADLVGVSMLREFAPLIAAIIVAGRSGSAYAAQIGTMGVTEEIDALRTLGIAPLELLVLPKLVAMLVALPLLTVFADALGVFGGMTMARAQLDVGYGEFLERFVKAVSQSSYWVGIAKAPVFALIVTVVGCFQGFRTRGGADSVGRQTTRSVVQAIFLVIVADALFSVAFSALNL
jgi:phospholipid/cholesterol/gamma-HCH transport system permease protein